MSEAEVSLHPLAAREVERAYRWYQERSPTAAAESRNQRNRTIALIGKAPLAPPA